jgi:hypothetical protein
MSDIQPAPANRAVFLSYAREDAIAARRLDCARDSAGSIQSSLKKQGRLSCLRPLPTRNLPIAHASKSGRSLAR